MEGVVASAFTQQVRVLRATPRPQERTSGLGLLDTEHLRAHGSQSAPEFPGRFASMWDHWGYGLNVPSVPSC